MTEALDAVGILARILTDHGPLHKDDIGRLLQDNGVVDPDVVMTDALDQMGCPAGQLLDERWVWLPTLLTGRVFTHRLGADEVTHDLLTVTPDLLPITALCEYAPYQQLADGSPVVVAFEEFNEDELDERGIPLEAADPYGALLLPPHTLSAVGAAEGDLIGVRLTTAGLVIERVTDPSPGDIAGAQLAATLGRDGPDDVGAAVWTACVANPELFTEALPPLSEIVDDAGLTRSETWLAPNGFDFALWRFHLQCGLLARRYDIDSNDAAVLQTLIDAYNQISTLLAAVVDELDEAGDDLTLPDLDEYADLLAEIGSELADPLLAQLLVNETVDLAPGGAAALGLFAETLEPKVARPAKVAYRWLRAVALERTGDVEAAEREFSTAESMDPDFPLALFDLARFAADRGDVERGLALLRRAGAESDNSLVQLLQQHRPEPRPDLGRNEPCWCGSGRKYKKCHLGNEQLSLTQRVGWLYSKACQHVLQSGWNELLAEVIYERGFYDDPDDGPEDDRDPLADPLPMDAVLFEGGAFEDFLQIRGFLLPDDERLLAEQWLLVQRSVFEVEQVHPGQSIIVRDVRTGDTHEVRERTASRHLKPGQLICARVVPDGEATQIFGGLEPVALHEREQLIDLLDDEPDPVELVAYLSRRFAPPTLTNTEGEQLTICEATVRVGDPVHLQAALDTTYDRVASEDPPQWLEHVITHGMPHIRATLVLDGDTLTVDTNSEPRMDRVLATLAGLDPAMTVLEDSRRPLGDARNIAKLAAQSPSPGEGMIAADDPETAAMLADFIRDYETKWLDQPIPALQGHTPRQAADDPTRRGDLIKLLDSFPVVEAGVGMDADRLRTALGLR